MKHKLLFFAVALIMIGAGCTTAEAEPQGEPVTIASSASSNVEYIEYREGNLDRSEEAQNVLFFHASWCSTCKALESNIVRDIEELSPNTTIHKVDYDTQISLRQRYRVPLQHTLIQVDGDGNEVTRWVGGNRVSEINSRLQ